MILFFLCEGSVYVRRLLQLLYEVADDEIDLKQIILSNDIIGIDFSVRNIVMFLQQIEIISEHNGIPIHI